MHDMADHSGDMDGRRRVDWRIGRHVHLGFDEGDGDSNLVSYYLLHPTWSPYGCNVSGTAYPYCVYFSVKSTSTVSALYMAYSSTIDGVYTWLGGSSPTNIISSLATAMAWTAPELVSMINVGGPKGTNYMYFGPGDDNSTYSVAISTGADNTVSGNGVSNWTMVGTAVNPNLSTDWTYTNSLKVTDNHVFRNACGFYEYFYTTLGSYNGRTQAIAYLVAASPAGPWFKYNGGPVIPTATGSPVYGTTNAIGDTAIVALNGRYTWLGNYDDGSTKSQSVALSMPDACAY